MGSLGTLFALLLRVNIDTFYSDFITFVSRLVMLGMGATLNSSLEGVLYRFL